mgnify:FL=1
MAKEWKEFDSCCPYCGADALVLTEAPGDLVFDDDDAKCSDCGCPGIVHVEEEWATEEEPGTAYVSWHEPDCTCAWCVANPI